MACLFRHLHDSRVCLSDRSRLLLSLGHVHAIEKALVPHAAGVPPLAGFAPGASSPLHIASRPLGPTPSSIMMIAGCAYHVARDCYLPQIVFTLSRRPLVPLLLVLRWVAGMRKVFRGRFEAAMSYQP